MLPRPVTFTITEQICLAGHTKESHKTLDNNDEPNLEQVDYTDPYNVFRLIGFDIPKVQNGCTNFFCQALRAPLDMLGTHGESRQVEEQMSPKCLDLRTNSFPWYSPWKPKVCLQGLG